MTVFGRVQGVGYRAFALRTAQRLGVSGFVKNNPDGSVYIEAEGDEDTLATFLQLCRQGPGWARVERINHTEYPVTGHNGFRVKY